MPFTPPAYDPYSKPAADRPKLRLIVSSHLQYLESAECRQRMTETVMTAPGSAGEALADGARQLTQLLTGVNADNLVPVFAAVDGVFKRFWPVVNEGDQISVSAVPPQFMPDTANDTINLLWGPAVGKHDAPQLYLLGPRPNSSGIYSRYTLGDLCRTNPKMIMNLLPLIQLLYLRLASRDITAGQDMAEEESPKPTVEAKLIECPDYGDLYGISYTDKVAYTTLFERYKKDPRLVNVYTFLEGMQLGHISSTYAFEEITTLFRENKFPNDGPAIRFGYAMLGGPAMFSWVEHRLIESDPALRQKRIVNNIQWQFAHLIMFLFLARLDHQETTKTEKE